AWNVAITTDIPLMIFSALTVALYLRARETGRSSDFLMAGVALAGALMSKYFAGLLAIAIFLHAVWRPTRGSLVGLAWSSRDRCRQPWCRSRGTRSTAGRT